MRPVDDNTFNKVVWYTTIIIASSVNGLTTRRSWWYEISKVATWSSTHSGKVLAKTASIKRTINFWCSRCKDDGETKQIIDDYNLWMNGVVCVSAVLFCFMADGTVIHACTYKGSALEMEVHLAPSPCRGPKLHRIDWQPFLPPPPPSKLHHPASSGSTKTSSPRPPISFTNGTTLVTFLFQRPTQILELVPILPNYHRFCNALGTWGAGILWFCIQFPLQPLLWFIQWPNQSTTVQIQHDH
jgi:hypothetical protein